MKRADLLAETRFLQFRAQNIIKAGGNKSSERSAARLASGTGIFQKSDVERLVMDCHSEVKLFVCPTFCHFKSLGKLPSVVE